MRSQKWSIVLFRNQEEEAGLEKNVEKIWLERLRKQEKNNRCPEKRWFNVVG